MSVHGDGSQTRSFTWIDDVVKGFVSAGMQDLPTGEAFNHGSTEEISIIDLATKITQFGEDVDLIHSEGYHGDVKRRLPNISNSEKLLDWKGKISLDEGFQMMGHSINP